MKNISLKILVLFLLSATLCYSQTSEQLYRKAQTLYNRIQDKTPSITSIPRYEEISGLLEKAVNKNSDKKELLKEIYPLLITAYDRQARYPDKHKTMQRYAETLYPRDREKQARWVKQQADKLRSEKETAEAITLYRTIAKKYSETETAPESLFTVAEIIKREENSQGVADKSINEYETIIKNYPGTKYSEEIHRILTKQYQRKEDYNKSVHYLKTFLKKYPHSENYEEVLFELGLLYRQNKKEDEAKKVWEEYLKKYPEGLYSTSVKTYLKEEF
jgi:tetratricopeptide (TPR) repeat protein